MIFHQTKTEATFFSCLVFVDVVLLILIPFSVFEGVFRHVAHLLCSDSG